MFIRWKEITDQVTDTFIYYLLSTSLSTSVIRHDIALANTCIIRSPWNDDVRVFLGLQTIKRRLAYLALLHDYRLEPSFRRLFIEFNVFHVKIYWSFIVRSCTNKN